MESLSLNPPDDHIQSGAEMKKSQTRNRARRQLRRARAEGKARAASAQPQPVSRVQQVLHRLGVRGERQQGAMAKWAALLGRAKPAGKAK
jgi:hypothetical protein